MFVETSLGSGREILRGIAHFSRQIGSWEIFHAARGLEDLQLTFADIADRSGFRHHEYLGHVLKQQLGKTPRQIRLEKTRQSPIST